MTTLSQIFTKLENGFYVVPEIQREFVWKNRQIKELAKSIFSKYPVGSIVTWEMPKQFIKEYEDLIRPLYDISIDNATYMIIDGQQRLTSLLLIKKEELLINNKKRKTNIYFNPTNNTFSFTKGKKLDKDPYWFKLPDILNAEDVYDVIEEKSKMCNQPKLKENKVIRNGLNKLREIFNTYDLPILEVDLKYNNSDDFLVLFETISHIFVKLNSTGTKIKLQDLVLALLTGKTRKELGESFKDGFNKIIDEAQNKGFDIDETVLVRLYLSITTNTIRFKDARNKLERMDARNIQDHLKYTRDLLNETIEWLVNYIGIKNMDYLQSKYALVTLAYLMKTFMDYNKSLTEDIKLNIVRWIVLASFEGRYTGQLETQLQEDLQTMNNKKSIEGLLANLYTKNLPRDVLEEEYDNKHIGLLSILYTLNNARDWYINGSLQSKEIKELRSKDIHIHHIFPKKYLKHAYSGESSVDDIGNITLISKEANEQIKDENPDRYLKQLYDKDPQLLERHFIPLDNKLWNATNYDKFLEIRREDIINAIREMLMINIEE